MIDQHPNNNHDQPRFFLVSFNCSLTQKHSSQIRAIKYFSVKEKKVWTWQGQTIGLLIDCRLINNSASFRAVARTLICLVYPPFLSTRRRNLSFVIMLITVFNELSLFGAVVAREHDVSPGNNGVSFEEDCLSAIDHLCARNQLPKRSKYCASFF